MAEMTVSQAINDAIAEEILLDERVFILGEDVAEAGTPFKVLAGLVDEFGTERVRDTPISEPGFMGVAVGAAITGMRPIVDLMFGDFLFLVMDQLCNQAAKTHYMSGGKLKVPLVLRTNMGASRRAAAQHSQSLHALAAHIPGLKVALPTTAADAKGLMKAAIRDENPVVIFENKLLYQTKGDVPDGEHIVPLGKARIVCEGENLTIVATSRTVAMAKEAAAAMVQDGISAEVIDPRSIVPLDEETIVASVKKTSRLLIVDEGYQSFGITGEIASRVGERAFYYLDAPIRRICGRDVPIPFSPALEDLTVPTAERIIEAAKSLFEKGMHDAV